MQMSSAIVAALLDQLVGWAGSVEWIDWLEVGGSLGRGAGDELSDIDAGIGVVDDGVPIAERVAAALRSAGDFAPVADSIVQDLDGRAHLIVVYADGRQLSLVVVPASVREGLPPQSLALLDRSGRLSRALPAEHWAPDPATLRDWAFEAWIGVGDAARHAMRGNSWRALRSLTEARDLTWQLWAATRDVPYPAFGAVSVTNAGLDAPDGMTATHPAALDGPAILDSARALAAVLRDVTSGHGVNGVATVIESRLESKNL
jgi:hypothetical protein